jgi:hypothetical protein
MNILRKKAGTIKELLEAENQIGALHEEIEATISRINYLKDQVNYSSINLAFYQTIVETIAANEETFLDRFSNAFDTGLQGLISISIAIVYLWPVALILAGIAFFVMFRKKGRLKVKV